MPFTLEIGRVRFYTLSPYPYARDMFVHIGAKAVVLSTTVVAQTETRQTPTPNSLGLRGRKGPCCHDRRPQTNSEADGLGSRRLLLPLIWSLSWEPPSVYDGPLATPLLSTNGYARAFSAGSFIGALGSRRW